MAPLHHMVSKRSRRYSCTGPLVRLVQQLVESLNPLNQAPHRPLPRRLLGRVQRRRRALPRQRRPRPHVPLPPPPLLLLPPSLRPLLPLPRPVPRARALLALAAVATTVGRQRQRDWRQVRRQRAISQVWRRRPRLVRVLAPVRQKLRVGE